MAKKRGSNWNTDYLTDADIYAAIRYLEPEARRTNRGKDDATDEEQSDAAAFVVSVIFMIIMLGLTFMLFYY